MNLRKTERGIERSGFTLLEVLLALALSVVLITGIGMAIRIHLVTLSKQQRDIESRQIARSVLMLITNDIRSAMQYRAQDFSALENLQLSEAMILGLSQEIDGDGGADPGDLAAAADDGDPGGQGNQGDPGSGEEGPSFGDPAAEDCVACRPTMLGTAEAINIDVSRLPRVDEYNPLIAARSDVPQLPSDVKTITYFVDSSPPVNTSTVFAGATSDVNGGLYRRQLDRAVAAYVEDPGGRQVDVFAKLISPEVASITLRYFDGESWLDQWDSEEQQGFPPAVEVILVIDSTRINDNNRSYQYSGFDPETMQLYRSVIHLPTSELGGG